MLSEFANNPSPVVMVVFFAAAALYAAVGHGGASAYLAVMGLWGVSTAEMKPVALVLNVAVSLVALASFARDGHFRGRLFWPLAAASVPAAFAGGWLHASGPGFKLGLAAALGFGAWRLCRGRPSENESSRDAGWPALVVLGLTIGFVSGWIGIGGGVFLTPLLVLWRWCRTKPAAAVSAAFILANSLAGLGGYLTKGGAVPVASWWLLPAVTAGGWLGASWGSGRAGNPALRRVLAAVLAAAATKFAIT